MKVIQTIATDRYQYFICKFPVLLDQLIEYIDIDIANLDLFQSSIRIMIHLGTKKRRKVPGMNIF